MRVAVDTGGTFTDCVSVADGQLKVLKLFSTPNDPALAVLDVLTQIGARNAVDLRHGTTIGTNAMLERKGARVAFVTTAGFEDTIAIGRQTRAKLYDWFAPVPVCLVPRELRFGVPERVSAAGEVLRSPTEEELVALVDAVRESAAEAVAIHKATAGIVYWCDGPAGRSQISMARQLRQQSPAKSRIDGRSIA